MGMEAAFFVASGTMGNLLGVLSLARSGEEVIAEADSHLFINEGGGAAALGGVQVRQVPTEAGGMTAEQERPAVRPVHHHHAPPVAPLPLDDSHAPARGRVWPAVAPRAGRPRAR